VSLLKIKIPSRNLGRQRCAEGFNSGVNGLFRAPCNIHFNNIMPRGLVRLAAGWTTRKSNPGWAVVLRPCPDQGWGPPRFLYNGYRVIPPGGGRGKTAGAWRWPPTPSSTEVKNCRAVRVLPFRALMARYRVKFALCYHAMYVLVS
jgi:hypothetical protein